MLRQLSVRRLILERLEARLPFAVVPTLSSSNASETTTNSVELFCRAEQIDTFTNARIAKNDQALGAFASSSLSSSPSLSRINPPTSALQQSEVIVDNSDPGYVETGYWVNSTIKGVNGTNTRFAKEYNDTATWNAPTLAPGYYSVAIWKVALPSNSPNARVSIVHNGITEPAQTINLATIGAGFITLGTFFFSGAPGEFVRLSQGTTVGILRADAVRFTPSMTANVAPTISGPVSYAVPGNAEQNFSNSITLADADVGLAPVQLSLSTTNGILTLPIASGITLLNGTNGGANLTVRGSLADLNAALVGLIYKPNLNFSGSDAILLTLNDLGNSGVGGPRSTTHSIALTVSNPVFVVDNGDPGYAETSVWVNSALKGSNVTSTRFANGINATASWNRPDLEPGYYEIAIWKVAVPSNSAHARVTIVHNGITEPAQTINLSTPGAGYVTLGTYFFDGSSTEYVRLSQGNTVGNIRSDAVRFTRSATALNKTPTIIAPATQNVQGNSSAIFSIANGNPIFVDDADTGNSQVELLIRSSNASLTLGNTNGLTFLPDGGIRVQGTLSNLNHALSGLKYQPHLNFSGNDALQITLKDLGNTGIGGPKSFTFTIAITVSKQIFIVDNNSLGYSETGAWVDSALTGVNGTNTRFANASNATATWNAPTLSPGSYSVAIWKVAASSNATNAQISVIHNNTTEAPLTVDLSTGLSEFIELGTFFFNGSPGEFIRLSQGGIPGNIRANTIRFTKMN